MTLWSKTKEDDDIKYFSPYWARFILQDWTKEPNIDGTNEGFFAYDERGVGFYVSVKEAD